MASAVLACALGLFPAFVLGAFFALAALWAVVRLRDWIER